MNLQTILSRNNGHRVTKKKQTSFFSINNRWFTSLLTILVALIIWEGVILIWDLPQFILPSPMAVWSKLIMVIESGLLIKHLGITLLEVLLGLAIGASSAVLLGYVIAKSRFLEKVLSPFLVASQAIPLVAIAPLLIIWFGPGMISKFIICSLIVFFPVLVNTIVGVRSVPENLHDLMHSMHASRWQTLKYLEIPAALPVFLGGLRIGATLSVIGAVVGEFVAADSGIGFLINVARGQYDTALVFVAMFTLIFMALVLYGSVILMEIKFLHWQKNP